MQPDSLQGLEALYSVYRADLLRFLIARTGDSGEAEEILQEIWIRIRQVATPPIANGRAYLYRMALNLARNSFKRETRYIAIDQDRLIELPDDAPDPEQATLTKIDARRATGVLANLSDRRREIFLARWRDGLGHAEIAVQFGLHKRTVQKELARAERFLKRLLDSA